MIADFSAYRSRMTRAISSSVIWLLTPSSSTGSPECQKTAAKISANAAPGSPTRPASDDVSSL
ncbi:MAG: hypothetical protein QGG36_19475 [Pirellulaceae bacterium]|nr:hypothetical protein [Pirellulaceae bacterium]